MFACTCVVSLGLWARSLRNGPSSSIEVEKSSEADICLHSNMLVSANTSQCVRGRRSKEQQVRHGIVKASKPRALFNKSRWHLLRNRDVHALELISKFEDCGTVWPMIDAAFVTQDLASASNEMTTATSASLLDPKTPFHQNEFTS